MRLKLIPVLILFLITYITVVADQSDKKVNAFTASVKYETNKDYGQAIKEIQKIYSEFNDDYLVNVRLGWLYYLNGKYDESIKYYNNAVRLSVDPVNYTANLRLGQIYLNTKNYLNAKKLILNVYNNYPGDYFACSLLGWTYLYLGSNSKAKELFTDTLILDPGNISATKGMELLKWEKLKFYYLFRLLW